MAVTPNLNLYKPDGDNYVSYVRDLNENYDKIDEAVGQDTDYLDGVQSDIAFVENTDTATHDIASGQYVIWKGALCRASSAISIGGTLSASNLTEVSGGMNLLNKMFSIQQGSVSGGGGNRAASYYRMGNMCYVTATGYFASSAFTSYYCGTLPEKCRPKQTVYGMTIADNDSNSTGLLQINSDGGVYILCRGSWWYQQNVRGDACFPCIGDLGSW